MKNIYKRYSQLFLIGLILFGLIITLVLVKAVTNLQSKAQFLPPVEAETAVKTGDVAAVSDQNAAGGQYLLFGNSTNAIPTPTTQPVTGTTYYLDCSSGNDSNNGTSPSSAWQSLSKANSATFNPGDALLLKRGCTWNGTLSFSESGSSTARILVDAYGSGSLPIINRNSNGATVSLSGSYITIQNLYLSATPPSYEAGCSNNPKGNTQGVSLESGSHDNIIQNNTIMGHYAGVFVRSGSYKNSILNNTFQDNNMMSPLDTSADNDAGAFGVLLWGDDNEIAYNTISGSDACSYDYTRDGSAVEIYGGQRNHIHHNIAFNNDAFAELGNSRSADNIFSYNKFTSNSSHSLFLVTRGSSDKYGPILRTSLYNNSIYLPQSYKDAIVCYAGCDGTIIKLRNNISWGGAGAIYADRAIDEDYNIFVGSVHINGGSNVGPHSLKTNPLFVNPNSGDLHLQTTSPANNAGTSVGYSKDLDGKAVGNPPEIGAYEL